MLLLKIPVQLLIITLSLCFSYDSSRSYYVVIFVGISQNWECILSLDSIMCHNNFELLYYCWEMEQITNFVNLIYKWSPTYSSVKLFISLSLSLPFSFIAFFLMNWIFFYSFLFLCFCLPLWKLYTLFYSSGINPKN